jgi:dipeptidyl-peptidase-4
MSFCPEPRGGHSQRPVRPVPAVFVAVIMAACLAASVTPASAQQRELTVADIFDPARRIDFDGNPPRGLEWLDDRHYLQPAGHGGPPLKVAAESGATEPLFDVAALETAIAGVPGLSETQAGRLARSRTHVMNGSRTALVFDFANDLYYHELGASQVTRLTQTPEAEQEVSFSPDGRLVAFVREHDLHVVSVDRPREHALTTDGDTAVRNGVLDWVYQEEIYGRGNFRGYWWSPDSTRIAFLRLDGSEVPEFTIVDHIEYHPEVEKWAYPKAGDPNPAVSLGIVDAAGGAANWVDLDAYTPSQPLIVSVGWTPDGGRVVFQVQDREQTWLDLNVADPQSERPTKLLRETTEAWVNVNGPPLWLADGSFLWLSERSGWKHLYHYRADGTLVRRITGGEWEVRQVHGADEQTGWIYWSGTERSHVGSDAYRVRLDGSDLTRLSAKPGSHRVQFNPGFTRYIDTWSTLAVPPQVRLHAADGAERRVIDANEATVLAEYDLSAPELLQVPNRDGFLMEAVMIKPPDFDPTRRYPVYQHVYGGPHIQRVRDRWSGSTYMFWQLLARQGVIVWVLDNRTASGKGAVSTWPVYKNFGASELRDIEDGLDWLAAQPYVDPDRIGIEGWSYGGFMVSYALTHSDRFAMGIAGGSVTDWRDYDTIYTERYMRMPQHNPDGYRRSSPRFNAGDLHGALLLVHGSMDENVHMQNTLQFALALQQAGKPFDMMIYPRSRHRLGGPDLELHRREKMLAFVLEHLRPEGGAGAVARQASR